MKLGTGGRRDCRIIANNIFNNITKLKLSTEKNLRVRGSRFLQDRLEGFGRFLEDGTSKFALHKGAPSLLFREGFRDCMAACSVRSSWYLVLV